MNLIKNSGKYLIYTALLYSLSTFAAIKCPSNEFFVEIDYDLNRVQSICGPPLKVNSFEGEVLNESQTVEKWHYLFNIGGNTVKLVLTFQGPVNHTYLTSIKDRGVEVAETNLCGSIIKVGDSNNAVKEKCNAPQYVEHAASKENTKAQTVKITELTYGGAHQQSPNTVFTFENNLLKYVTNE